MTWFGKSLINFCRSFIKLNKAPYYKDMHLCQVRVQLTSCRMWGGSRRSSRREPHAPCGFYHTKSAAGPVPGRMLQRHCLVDTSTQSVHHSMGHARGGGGTPGGLVHPLAVLSFPHLAGWACAQSGDQLADQWQAGRLSQGCQVCPKQAYQHVRELLAANPVAQQRVGQGGSNSGWAITFCTGKMRVDRQIKYRSKSLKIW